MALDQTRPANRWGRPAGLLAGRYELDEILGQGGMGVVRGGRDTRLDRPVAVKFLRPEVAGVASARARFESEARAAAKLAPHPNVVAVFDSGEEAGLPFIVMERLSGRTLRDLMASGPLSGTAATTLARQVLGALGAAHGAGLIHRDIKPGNILDASAPVRGPLAHEAAPDVWKVADFGIAKSLEPIGEDHTATGLLIGTPKYLPPERFFGGTATVSGDLYALGVVLYEALAGRVPVLAERPEEWAAAVSTNEPRPIGALRPDVGPALCAAIDRCLAKDPAQRFASARDMAAAIAGNPAQRPTETTVPLGATEHTAVLPAAGPETRARPVGRHGVLGGTRGLAGGTRLPSSLQDPPASRWTRHRQTIGAALAGALAVVVLVVIVSLVATSNPSGSGTTTPARAPGYLRRRHWAGRHWAGRHWAGRHWAGRHWAGRQSPTRARPCAAETPVRGAEVTARTGAGRRGTGRRGTGRRGADQAPARRQQGGPRPDTAPARRRQGGPTSRLLAVGAIVACSAGVLTSCGSSQAALSDQAAAELVPEVQAVRDAAAAHEPALAASRLAKLRTDVARLEEADQITAARAAQIDAAVGEVAAQLHTVSTTTTTTTTTVPPHGHGHDKHGGDGGDGGNGH